MRLKFCQKFFLGAFAIMLAACQPKTVSYDYAPPKALSYTGPAFETPAFDPSVAITIVRELSDDDYQGRKTASPGGEAARDFIVAGFETLGFCDETVLQPFTFALKGQDAIGVNVACRIKGEVPGGAVLVITAHYDHLGARSAPDGGDAIFNGADDNASGVGGLFAVGQSFANLRPAHDVILLALDAEEQGLEGARAFLKTGALGARPSLNLNLDMISQSQKGELYMSGGYATPALMPLAQRAAMGTGLTLRFGHDKPEHGEQDWTNQSDHGPFHEAGYPFAYFGVEDHDHYHAPSDEFGVLPVTFYTSSLKTVVNMAHILDENLDALAKPARKSAAPK